MNSLRIIKITFITALVSFAATSCMDNDPAPSTYGTPATLLLKTDNPEEIIPTGAPFYFLADDSTMLYPINHEDIKLDKVKNNQRFSVLFTKYTPEETKTASKKEPLLITMTGLYDILTKDVLQTSEIDSITGNNIANPQKASSYSGGIHGSKTFMNILYRYYHGQNPQRVYLIDNLESPNSIIDGYYQLEFRLSGKSNMFYGEIEEQFISFPLDEKYLKEGIKGLRISFKEDETDKLTVVDYPYPTK